MFPVWLVSAATVGDGLVCLDRLRQLELAIEPISRHDAVARLRHVADFAVCPFLTRQTVCVGFTYNAQVEVIVEWPKLNKTKSVFGVNLIQTQKGATKRRRDN